jgi:aldehyde dehydrogenase (NAD+)
MYSQQILDLRTAFKSGKTRHLAWKRAQLLAMKRMVQENNQTFVDALHTDLHRCKFEGQGLELLATISEIDFALENMNAWLKPTFTSVPALALPATHEVVYEPYGVGLLITPFNYPLVLLLSPLIGVILAGNCAVLKPSELARACESAVFDLIPKYMDNECFKVIRGDVQVSSDLLKEQWDFIFYTGSTRVGKIVAAAAAVNLTPCLLELGGKSPVYIDSSVTDMELITKRIIWGKCVNAGQTCIAPDYALVHEDGDSIILNIRSQNYLILLPLST